MHGNDVDTFIAYFKCLAREAEHDLNAAGTINLFCNGLKSWVFNKVMDRQNEPANFQEWEDAAREVIRRAARKTAVLSSKGYQMTGKSHRRHHDEAVPMDVDPPGALFKAYTDEDKEHYKIEGQCFRCDKQGHMARQCPTRKEQPMNMYKSQNKPNRKYDNRSKRDQQLSKSSKQGHGYRKSN